MLHPGRQFLRRTASGTPPIPVNPPLHTNSANFVIEFLRQKKAYYGTVSINTKAYASPVYVVDADTPTVKVTEWDCQRKGWVDSRIGATMDLSAHPWICRTS